MGYDLKYGKVTLENKQIPDDEPVFVLRAQDKLAVVALVAYLEAAHVQSNMNAGALDSLFQTLSNFRNWPNRKLPD